jgi:hypothetical protein
MQRFAQVLHYAEISKRMDSAMDKDKLIINQDLAFAGSWMTSGKSERNNGIVTRTVGE